MVGFSDLLNARLFDEIGAAAQKLDWKLVEEEAPKGVFCLLKNAPPKAKLKALSNLGDKAQGDQFMSAAHKIEKRAEQYTEQAFDAVSTGVLPDAKLDMGLHNRSLQRALNETLAAHPDTLAQKAQQSAYFGPSEEIPEKWVQDGWEQALTAFTKDPSEKGALQVPARIRVQPSNLLKQDHWPFKHDLTDGYDDYIQAAKAYHGNGGRGHGGTKFLITREAYNEMAKAEFIPEPVVTPTEEIKFSPSTALKNDYRYQGYSGTGIHPDDFSGVDENGTVGAFHYAELPKTLGRIGVVDAKVKSFALPPTVEEVEALSIRGSNIAEVHLPQGLKISGPSIYNSRIQNLIAADAKLGKPNWGTRVQDSKIDRLTAPNSTIEGGVFERSTLGVRKSEGPVSDLRGANFNGSQFTDSELTAVMNNKTFFEKSDWERSSVRNLSEHYGVSDNVDKNEAVKRQVLKNPFSPAAFDGVPAENAPTFYSSPDWKPHEDANSNQVWPPQWKKETK
jgi:hypothetical protein